MRQFQESLLLRKTIAGDTNNDLYQDLRATINWKEKEGSVRRIFWRGNYVVFEKMLSILN